MVAECAVTNDAELNLDDAPKLIIVASAPPGSGSMIAGEDFVRRRLLRSRLSLRRAPSGKNKEEERGETAARSGS